MKRAKGILADAYNLTTRMSMQRFARLIDAFSKLVENHSHALALYFVFYNFVFIGAFGRPGYCDGSDRLWSWRT